MQRTLLVVASVSGFLAVALGAFGAHGLEQALRSLDPAQSAQRLDWWRTAAHYHLTHALAIALAAYLGERASTRAAAIAGWCFTAGIVIFSGSLYLMTLTGARALGMVTPLGGLALLAGWVGCAIAALRRSGAAARP